MPLHLAFLRSPVDLETLDCLDARSALLVLGDAALLAFDHARIDRLIARRSMVVAAASKDLSSFALAAALLSDYFALSESAALECREGSFGDVVAGAIWRSGRCAKRLLVAHRLDAAAAREIGLCDAIIPRDDDPLAWVESWLGKRSVLALQSAAALIRLDRNDAVERAEFARLFSTGEPQQGLRSFLDKQPLDFSSDVIVETI